MFRQLTITVVTLSPAFSPRRQRGPNILEKKTASSLLWRELVRYRTAAILSIVLIGGMFAIPALIESAFLPSLKQGIPNPPPGYEQLLLAVAVFFLRWRFVLAVPILLVLFTVAAFSSAPRVRQQQSRTRSRDDQSMSRPVGITVIALLNILGALAFAVSEMLSAPGPEGGLRWMLVAAVVLGICLGVALLRLHNWSRAVVVALYGLSLVRVLGHAIFAQSVADVFSVLVPGLYVLWAVWYMHQPHVKASFGRG